LTFKQGACPLFKRSWFVDLIFIPLKTNQTNMNKAKTIQQKQLIEVLQEPQDVQVTLLQHATQLALMLVNQLLENQVFSFTGQRYSHAEEGLKTLVRHGSNPGSVKIQEKKYPVQVPRVRNRDTNKFLPLPVWDSIKNSQGPDELLLQRMLLGISTRDYEKVIQEAGKGFGVSKSSISKQFVAEAAAALEEFKSRSLKEHKYVAIFIDGKHLRAHQIVIAMGITEAGEKHILDFIQADTENTRAVRQLLVSLNHRGLSYSEGLLFIIDGAKGLRAAIETVYGHKAVVQRCVWHKQENVLSYLNEEQKAEYKFRLQACYRERDHKKAKKGLLEIKQELSIINPGAARSLEEGLEETLTLQKLALVKDFRQSLSTTNCIENVNRLIQQKTGKIKYWVNGKQIERWFALSFLDIENRLNKIQNYKHLTLLTTKLKEITKPKKAYQLLLIEDKAAALSSITKMSTKNRA
jgi:transposase-like protein